MTTRSFTLLVNPASGGGTAPAVAVAVARLLRGAGATVEVGFSPGPRATGGLVAAAVARDDVVVAVGGDGMVSFLAGPVAAAGGTLGILPAGRGNDFARMLGLPGGLPDLAATLLRGPARRVDLVGATWADGATRVVAGSIYAGVDARAAEHVTRMHRVPQRLQYPLAAVRALAAYRPTDVRVVVDGTVHELRAATVVVANSGYYGKGMHIAPGAVVDDGLLDVVVVEAASRASLLRSLPRVYGGTHAALAEVTMLRGRRVELSGTGGPTTAPLQVGGDGEALGVLPGPDADPLVVEVRPGALAVLGQADQT